MNTGSLLCFRSQDVLFQDGHKEWAQKMIPLNVPKECPKIISSWPNLTHPNYIQKRMTNPRKGAPRPRACKFTVWISNTQLIVSFSRDQQYLIKVFHDEADTPLIMKIALKTF